MPGCCRVPFRRQKVHEGREARWEEVVGRMDDDFAQMSVQGSGMEPWFRR